MVSDILELNRPGEHPRFSEGLYCGRKISWLICCVCWLVKVVLQVLFSLVQLCTWLNLLLLLWSLGVPGLQLGFGLVFLSLVSLCTWLNL